MADDMQEIEVTGNPVANKTKLRSPWKAALLGLPGGPFVSLGFGLAQHFQNKNYLEQEAARQTRDAEERKQLKAVLSREMALADPDEKRLLEYAQGRVADGYQRVAGGDKSGYQIIEHAQEIIEGLIGKDIDARKQEQAKQQDTMRDLVSASAKGYRQEYQDTRNAFTSTNRLAQQILDLVAQPDFDPNKPINKAHLAELLSMGGLMFKDTPDLLDGVTQGVGAFNQTAGGVVGGLSTLVKSEDFKVTPEDYNRLALNMQKYTKIYAQQKLSELGRQASNLDAWGKQNAIFPKEYNLQDYISGGEKELQMTPNPVFTGGFKGPDVKLAPTGELVRKKYKGRFGWETFEPGTLMHSLDPINWGFDTQTIEEPIKRPTN